MEPDNTLRYDCSAHIALSLDVYGVAVCFSIANVIVAASVVTYSVVLLGRAAAVTRVSHRPLRIVAAVFIIISLVRSGRAFAFTWPVGVEMVEPKKFDDSASTAGGKGG